LPDLSGLDTAASGLSGPERLALFRAALASGRANLQRTYTEKSLGPQTLIETNAALIDGLLTRAWEHFRDQYPSEHEPALIAVGGYGRGELYPFSDVDLLLLLPRSGIGRSADFIQAFLQFCWDLGLEVGHSTRTIRECTREARKDITIMTNLMEARRLAGSIELFESLQKQIAPTQLWPSHKFFSAKLAEQAARHHRFDDTAYKLEPNIKEAPGGLRDIHMVGWVAQRHFHTSRLHDLVQQGFLEEAEYRALLRDKDLLTRVRCGLHYLAGQREDRLLFDSQRALAAQFGYKDKPGSLAVEQFMKHYYRTVKELRLLNEILLQHFREALLGRGRARTQVLNRRFQSHGGYLQARHPRIFERAPYALLELFHVMQQHPSLEGVRADTIRLVRANLSRINTEFRKDLGCRALFMEILREKRGITHEFRRMNAYGVLGAYLPAFGRIVGQMQHDLFHVYTVDEHTLFVLRNLRRFTVPEHFHEFPLASEIIRHLVKPERLYLAGLFHDIGKGRGGDHSVIGEKEVLRFCRMHALSTYDARFIAWLVRHHLIMSWTAQREDISDEEVLMRFARKVGDQERLDNLYLLTVADIRGTSPKVWNMWKGRLLSQLYAATTRVLRRGLATAADAKVQIADRKREAGERLRRLRIAPAAVEQFWERMEDEYFLRHDAEALAWHAQMITRTRAAQLPLVATRSHPEAGGTEVLVFAPDREDLLAIVTGGLDRLNLSIWDARIHSTRSGFALHTYLVLDHAGNPVTGRKPLAELERAMREQLRAPRPGRDTRSTTLPRALKHFPIETRVSFSTSPNDQQTIMEVAGQDRPGLLYQVALALQHCKVRLVTAKVATYGERAEDIFFITDRDGHPLGDAQQRACLESEIIDRLAPAVTATPRAITI